MQNRLNPQRRKYHAKVGFRFGKVNNDLTDEEKCLHIPKIFNHYKCQRKKGHSGYHVIA